MLLANYIFIFQIQECNSLKPVYTYMYAHMSLEYYGCSNKHIIIIILIMAV